MKDLQFYNKKKNHCIIKKWSFMQMNLKRKVGEGYTLPIRQIHVPV